MFVFKAPILTIYRLNLADSIGSPEPKKVQGTFPETTLAGYWVQGALYYKHMFACYSQPSECGRQRTLNIVHAQTAAQQQSNGSSEARMSGKCGEWRD